MPKTQDEKRNYPTIKFELPAYERVSFEMISCGVVSINFGRINTEVEIDISQYGFTLKYDDSEIVIEREGIWSEFPQKFAEFHREFTADRYDETNVPICICGYKADYDGKSCGTCVEQAIEEEQGK